MQNYSKAKAKYSEMRNYCHLNERKRKMIEMQNNEMQTLSSNILIII